MCRAVSLHVERSGERERVRERPYLVNRLVPLLVRQPSSVPPLLAFTTAAAERHSHPFNHDARGCLSFALKRLDGRKAAEVVVGLAGMERAGRHGAAGGEDARREEKGRGGEEEEERKRPRGREGHGVGRCSELLSWTGCG